MLPITKRIRTRLLFLVLFISAFFVLVVDKVQAYDPPIGIPDPGMWGSIHPIDTPNPDVATRCPAWPSGDTAGCYYVDFESETCDDTLTYGNPNAARCTLPGSPVPAGSYIELHGNNNTTRYERTFSGTEENPIWLVGGADFTSSRGLGINPGSQYLIVDSFLGDGGTSGTGIGTGGSNHICIRNSIIRNKEFLNNSAGIGASSGKGEITHDIVIHNVDISYLGLLFYPPDFTLSDDPDFHGVAVGASTGDNSSETYNVWVLDSKGHHISGNLVQVNGGNFPFSYRNTHHIYVGRNETWENRQAGFWSKAASDVIFSQNYSHDIAAYGPQGGDGLGHQYSPHNAWFLFNKVKNCNFGLRQSSSGAHTAEWILGGTYVAGDNASIVTHNGHIYQAKTNNTGTADNEPGVGADWQLRWGQSIDDAPTDMRENRQTHYIGNIFYDIKPRKFLYAWESDKSYKYAMVTHNGRVYTAWDSDHTSSPLTEPGVGINWEDWWRDTGAVPEGYTSPSIVEGEAARALLSKQNRNGIGFSFRKGTHKRVLVNNTVYDAGDGVVGSEAPSSPIRTSNNLFGKMGDVAVSSYNYHLEAVSGWGQHLVTDADYDLYYDGDRGFKARFGNAEYNTPAEFFAATGDCEHCVTGDPLFVDAANYNLRISSASSPAMAGTRDPVYDYFESLYGINIDVDFDGNPRPASGPWTIGAFEFQNKNRADVDNSSAVNTTDALLTLRNSLGLSMTGTAWQVSSTTGDVNCDGSSNSTDALLILRYSLGLTMNGTGWCE